jgi:hypothetical protein
MPRRRVTKRGESKVRVTPRSKLSAKDYRRFLRDLNENGLRTDGGVNAASNNGDAQRGRKGSDLG